MKTHFAAILALAAPLATADEFACWEESQDYTDCLTSYCPSSDCLVQNGTSDDPLIQPAAEDGMGEILNQLMCFGLQIAQCTLLECCPDHCGAEFNTYVDCAADVAELDQDCDLSACRASGAMGESVNMVWWGALVGAVAGQLIL